MTEIKRYQPFFLTLATLVAGWFYIAITTINQGFPIAYYSGVVHCAFPCLRYGNSSKFLLDVLFTVATPFIVQGYYNPIRKTLIRYAIQNEYLPFFLALAVMLFGWCYVWASTRNAPAADGRALEGFPLVYYAWGGRCLGECPTYKNDWILAFDIFLTIALPIAIQSVWNYWHKKGAP